MSIEIIFYYCFMALEKCYTLTFPLVHGTIKSGQRAQSDALTQYIVHLFPILNYNKLF